jgi:hypothetical protein
MKRGPVRKLIQGVAVTVDKDELGWWRVSVDDDNARDALGVSVLSCSRFRSQALLEAESVIFFLRQDEEETQV